jgi:hypothetical protein
MTRKPWIPAAILVALVLFVLFTKGPPPAKANPPGTFSFAVLGDAPYYKSEEWQHRVVRQDLDQHELAFVVHVGDIFWIPCSDAMYRKTRSQFDALRAPVFYTPGDNEWSDCWEPRPGGYQPLERLAILRRIFYTNPPDADRQLPAFPENARWEHEGLVFATVHMPGSRNATKLFPGRSPADDAEVRDRTAAAIAWLGDTFARARSSGVPAVVIAFHANPSFELPRGHAGRAPYESFITALESEAVAFGKPVLVVQGDDHVYLVDRPLSKAPNLTRMQVPGSRDVGWVRVIVTPGATPSFTFEQRVVPRWKYW